MNEITSASPSKSALQFGILFGAIMVLELIVGYIMNIDPISNPAYGTAINVLNYLLLPAILIYLACNNFKKMNLGYISFGECLKTGVLICVIAALIYGIFFWIFTLIFPEFIPDLLQKTRAATIAKSPEMTQEQLDMVLSWTEKFMKPFILIPFMIVMYAFIGLIYSLIIGAILKKDKPVSF